jgi:hypothetical protein
MGSEIFFVNAGCAKRICHWHAALPEMDFTMLDGTKRHRQTYRFSLLCFTVEVGQEDPEREWERIGAVWKPKSG